MPSIYGSVTSNTVHINEEINIQFHIQANSSFSRIIHRYDTIGSRDLPQATGISSTIPSKRMSTVATVFIVLATVVGFIFLCGLLWYIHRRWKRHKSSPTRTKAKPSTTPTIPVALVSPKRPPVDELLQCRKPLCEDYIRKLSLPKGYFGKKYDKCFCKKCHNRSKTDARCGNDCMELHGWIQLGLRPSQAHTKGLQVFREWKTSYYGTTPNRLSSILDSRFIPLDGDTLKDGTQYKSGHPDPSHCTTCPSLSHASESKFAVRSTFKAIDGNNYYVRVVLQCKQRPDGFSTLRLTSTCIDFTCNTGHCIDSTTGPSCICDEGFTGVKCDQQTSGFYNRIQLIPGLADPDILAINDDLFYLTGTFDGMVLPLFQSTDLINFQLKTTYNPSISDSFYKYCLIWAPDLSKHGTGYDLYFSAQRVLKSSSCPANGQDVTTFYTKASDNNLIFGAPVLVDFGNGAPKGRIATGCNTDGCLETVRIDSAIVGPENNRWFFYVWFSGGNNIASFPMASPTSLVANAGPASFSIPSSEEMINEAPEVFWREGQYYLFISTAFFDSQYSMSYIMAPTIADLTRKRAVRIHSNAQRNSAGKLIQSHGHNSIVERRGQFFNIFHQGTFDSTGRLIERSTFKQRLTFRSDGSIQTLNTVSIRWTQLLLHQYSLDIVKKDGSVIGPCINFVRIGAKLETSFIGICPDGGDQLVNKGDIIAFRLFYTRNSIWRDFVEVKYDGVSDQLAFYLSGGITKHIVLRWNERLTGTKYSIDVRHKDGTWIAPCVGDLIIGSNIEYVFDRNCQTAKVFIEPNDISYIRVCSAINNDWGKAICGGLPYDGKMIYVAVTIP
ncbi:unnamed protein product [Rotaria magnacalcarata]|uniref:EGF-like domain-containing protein n=1 Tax=Rotaria magnacalcarata TaxID=392030 RepID=A0A819DHT9_9BILA|nr:unnamed protein product [Rotaria magnacalcarata]